MVLSHATISTYLHDALYYIPTNFFATKGNEHWNRAFTRLFFPSAAKNVLGMRLDW